MDELLSRIAQMLYRARTGRDNFDSQTEDFKDGLIREAYYEIFKHERVLRDPFIQVRNLKGEVLGDERQRSLESAKRFARDIVQNGSEDTVDIYEIFEQRLGGMTAQTTRQVVEA